MNSLSKLKSFGYCSAIKYYYKNQSVIMNYQNYERAYNKRIKQLRESKQLFNTRNYQNPNILMVRIKNGFFNYISIYHDKILNNTKLVMFKTESIVIYYYTVLIEKYIRIFSIQPYLLHNIMYLILLYISISNQNHFIQ